MKFVVANRSFADPEVAARKLLDLAYAVEPVQDGRIQIEKINWPFQSELRWIAGQRLTVAGRNGWRRMARSGRHRAPLFPSLTRSLMKPYIDLAVS